MTSDANSGRPGLWLEAKYPGDSVRSLMVYRRDAAGRIELGDVRIQEYDSYLKVSMFVPGIEDPPHPGSTPHVWPEKHRDTTNAYDADATFDNYVQEVYAAGWQNYYPERSDMGACGMARTVFTIPEGLRGKCKLFLNGVEYDLPVASPGKRRRPR